MSGTDRDGVLLFDRPLFPGQGLPERRVDQNPEVPGWSRLAKDSPLGQKQVVIYDADSDALPAAVTILQLNGTDLDATQVQVTLGSPMVIPKTFAELAGSDAQNLTGEFGNDAMGQWGDFPGTTDSISWPPFVYVLEWGIGGARTRMFVDAVNGARVNLTCSFLSVYAIVSPDVANQPGTSGAYVLSAFVGPGWPTAGSAQRTIYLGDIDSQAVSDIGIVPPHARRATVIGQAAPPVAPAPQIPPVTVAYLRFFQDPDGLVCVGNYIVNGNQPIPFPIPNGAQYFAVVSGMGATAPFAALFELAA